MRRGSLRHIRSRTGEAKRMTRRLFDNARRRRDWTFVPGLAIAIAAVTVLAGDAFAHAVTVGDKGFIQEIVGLHLIPFMYLGAKHMVTGHDHILFLFGVIFFPYKLTHVGLYVSLLPLRHSTTMLLCVSLA